MMGMLDALMVGAASGAGAGLADAGAQYGKLTAEQILENQRANMEVEKARRIQEDTIAATNADQANTGQIYNKAFQDAAGFAPGSLPSQGMPAVVSADGTPTSPSTAPAAGSPAALQASAAPTTAPGTSTAPGLISAALASKNPQGMMSPEDAASYRKGMLAGAQALMAAGKTKEASEVMANLEATYHNMGFAGSMDKLTGETTTPDSEKFKALAKWGPKQLTPEEQGKLKAQTLEYNTKYLDSIFGDDSTYKALLSDRVDSLMNKELIQQQIDSSRASKVAAMELASHGVPIEQAASAVHAFMGGAQVVKDQASGALGIDLGNGKAVKLPLVLQRYVRGQQPTPPK